MTLVALLVLVGVTPLPNAHAHNDYVHPRPLLDALDAGFCSVEADVFLEDGKLLVGHTRKELRPDRTLETLYLEPLAQRIKSNGGWVYRADLPLQLLIDIKADGERVYEVLRPMLERYASMLTRWDGEHFRAGAVSVVISGDRPFEKIAKSSPRYCAIDGRAIDLERNPDPRLVPLISENWLGQFKWLGVRSMPSDQKTRLQEFVAKAHGQGRKVRFWATPESPDLWKELWSAKVDFIGADRFGELRRFLLEQRPRN